MVWLNFDWFQWNAEQQGKSLDRTVKVIYELAYEQFRQAHADDLKGAEGPELDESDRWSYIDFLNEEFREQRAALALMTFSLLAKSIILHLKQITRGLDRRFPAKSAPEGKSELERVVSEYQKRFGISLENLPKFPTVREVVLARNSMFHGEGPPSEDYMLKTEARFLDETGQINLTSELLNTAILDLKEFVIGLGHVLKDKAQAQARGGDDTLTEAHPI